MASQGPNPSSISNTSKVLILGAGGMVGTALKNRLLKSNFTNLLTPTSSELNLLDQHTCLEYWKAHKPEVVIMAAGKVGGILSNINNPTRYILENLKIHCHAIDASLNCLVPNFIQIASSCIYPKNREHEISENDLLTGPLEETNEPFAIAKIAALKTVESIRKEYKLNYYSLLACNLYGPHDSFDLENGHVLASLIKKIVDAKLNDDTHVEIWGTGSPLREFLYVEDMADACIHIMNKNVKHPYINIGHEIDISIKELAKKIAHIVRYKGDLIFNKSYPDGVKRKKLNTSLLNETYDWRPQTSLEEGILKTINFYESQKK